MMSDYYRHHILTMEHEEIQHSFIISLFYIYHIKPLRIWGLSFPSLLLSMFCDDDDVVQALCDAVEHHLHLPPGPLFPVRITENQWENWVFPDIRATRQWETQKEIQRTLYQYKNYPWGFKQNLIWIFNFEFWVCWSNSLWCISGGRTSL